MHKCLPEFDWWQLIWLQMVWRCDAHGSAIRVYILRNMQIGQWRNLRLLKLILEILRCCVVLYPTCTYINSIKLCCRLPDGIIIGYYLSAIRPLTFTNSRGMLLRGASKRKTVSMRHRVDSFNTSLKRRIKRLVWGRQTWGSGGNAKL